MTSSKRSRAVRRATSEGSKSGPSPRRSRSVLLGAAAVLTVAAVTVVMVVSRDGTTVHGRATASRIVMTGAHNEMGMPIIRTTGTATGSTTAGGVYVEGATRALGRVPLDVAVRPTWTLRNLGTEPVTLGDVHTEVMAGCCPGAVTIAHRRIAPGGSTMLMFELSMHPGMDGWHDMALHVPVTTRTGSSTLTLEVTGDFRN